MALCRTKESEPLALNITVHASLSYILHISRRLHGEMDWRREH